MPTPSPSRHALFPGTFDPFTLGHLDLVQRGAAIFEKLTVVVASHHSKHQLLDAPDRLELVRQAIAGIEGVEVVASRGLLVDSCEELGAEVILRGVRNGGDLDYELQMASANRAMRPRVDTVFLAPVPPYAYISSTLVRQIASMGGDVSSFVPPGVADALRRRFAPD